MAQLKQDVLAALLKILKDGPHQREYGICCSVIDYYQQAHPEKHPDDLDQDADAIDDLLVELMSTWKHHSGSMSYPIPVPSGMGSTPSSYFWNMSVDKWDLNTPTGMLRLNLLSYTIDQLQIQLSKS